MNDVKSVEEIKETIKKFKADLPISRVPAPTLERFKQLSEMEYSGDYGMTLKFLLDFYMDHAEREYIMRRMDILENKLMALETSFCFPIAEPKKPEAEKPKPKTVKMLNGKERIVGRGEINE